MFVKDITYAEHTICKIVCTCSFVGGVKTGFWSPQSGLVNFYGRKKIHEQLHDDAGYFTSYVKVLRQSVG